MNWKKLKMLTIFYALLLGGVYISVLYGARELGVVPETPDKVLLKLVKVYDIESKYATVLERIISNSNSKEMAKMFNVAMLKDINRLIDRGNNLVVTVLRLCSDIENKIDTLKISESDKLRLTIKIDRIKNECEEFGFLLNGQREDIGYSKVLDIDRKLSVILISKGYLDGLRVGRVLWIPKANCHITIIAARNYVSAAVINKGDINKISVGMLVESNSNKNGF